MNGSTRFKTVLLNPVRLPQQLDVDYGTVLMLNFETDGFPADVTFIPLCLVGPLRVRSWNSRSKRDIADWDAFPFGVFCEIAGRFVRVSQTQSTCDSSGHWN